MNGYDDFVYHVACLITDQRSQTATCGTLVILSVRAAHFIHPHIRYKVEDIVSERG